MRILLILTISLALTGCGSLITVASPDQKITSSLNKRNTNCESIPRAYSGLSYDFCNLHSNPRGIHFDWALGFYAVDGVISAAVDTVLLPYTGYKQYKNGNIAVDKPRSNP